MRIAANGETLDLPEGLTLFQLLRYLKVTVETAIIEHNGNVISRDHWANALNEGDQVEILQFMGGG